MVEDVVNIGFITTKVATSHPSSIWSWKKITYICKTSFFICLPSLNYFSKCMSEKWLRTCSTSGLLQLKWLPVGHLVPDLENKMTCICKPSICICLPSLTYFGKCMSEKWLRTCSTRVFFLQLKLPPVSHVWLHRDTKWCAYVFHHVLSLCQVQIKSVHTCPRYGCACTHARTHLRTKIKFEIHKPCFGPSPMGAKSQVANTSSTISWTCIYPSCSNLAHK